MSTLSHRSCHNRGSTMPCGSDNRYTRLINGGAAPVLRLTIDFVQAAHCSCNHHQLQITPPHTTPTAPPITSAEAAWAAALLEICSDPPR
jgi:hypothetical protein